MLEKCLNVIQLTVVFIELSPCTSCVPTAVQLLVMMA